MEGNKTFTYSLAEPKEGLTKAEVEAVMTSMIEKKAVVVNGIFPTAVKEALIRSTEDTVLA